ncbi:MULTISPECIES: penicillin-binding protein 2 [Psychrobacter]|jgi:penicillin-binding protein 2|uniref:Peptidoglycan D,D-transpeptidase MrdA n=1 Tax=Psychrobacter pacificensis TaxID=112002 RepID=A0A1G6VIA9_9GAMM|nr:MULTISPECIES: penicillin-binding protein 2 [Psychrobacter]AOY43325.1 penicillin-binding protein 2 [Psychrobacter sp. AntiMn-1]GLR28468.1 penicillin-binding protein 2 [Psychrobacter pacificensis]SDD53380.1 peptidoglycan glycosyltransferase [Psychrobacter pacificensis]
MNKPLTPNTEQVNSTFTNRIIIFGILILLGLGGLITRYGYLQVYAHDKYTTQSDNNRIKLISAPPSRGYIYDRNGIILADNQPVFTAMLSPDEVDNPERTLSLLAPIFDLTAEDITDILARLNKNKNDPVTIKIDLTEAQLAQFSERKPFFRGVSIQSKLTRDYPYDELFAHVIGYVGRINDKESKRIDKDRYAGTDLIGKIGIEDYYEDILLGQPGYQSVETDAHGNILRQLDTKPPTSGNDITLSLDYGLQKVAQQQLDGRRGAIVAIDPKNGDVLAFVSNPSYDPNPFISGISFKDYDALREDLDQPLYNRALQGTYPPGSTIKPFEGLGGIHYGLRDWNSTIYDPGYFSLPGDSHRFRDWKRGGHGTVDLKKSIQMSVDTYYYKLAYEMGIQRLHDWMVRFGFGDKTGIDLPNEKSGIMPSPKWKKDTYDKDWLPGETISVSIGQGYFLATPLQIANATAMTASKGKHITPHLLKSSDGAAEVKIIDKPDGKIDYNGQPSDWLRMHDAMESVVENGTGRGIYTPRYRIAGKTGTAQVKSIAQGKRYDKSAIDKRHWDHAWFNGFAPVEDPQIALAVLVENGGGGSTTAAPIGRALFDYWMLQRKTDPVLPPSADELKVIKRQKAFEKALKDALREKEAKALAEQEAAEAQAAAATSE